MAYVYQRGKIYWGKVQRKGHFYTETLGTTSKREANKRLNAWVTRIEIGEWQEKGNKNSFDLLLESYTENNLDNLTIGTVKRYHSSIKCLSEHFEGIYLDEITAAEL